MAKVSGARTGRGRPSVEEVASRRRAVLDATAALLIEGGRRAATTTAVAARAGVSKESLYSWFGDKIGLLTALVEANAAGLSTRLTADPAALARPEEVLTAFGVDLLTLLTGESSLALNRAALAEMPDHPHLAAALLRSGRFATGAIVEQYLADCHASGTLAVPDPPAAFSLLYGLLVQDLQIRALLGDRGPGSAEIAERAAVAARRFLALLAAEAGPPPPEPVRTTARGHGRSDSPGSDGTRSSFR